MKSLDLLQEFVSIPGPPGEEGRICDAVAKHVERMKLTSRVDAKGNLIVNLGKAEMPRIVVTAHLDEIAMIVAEVYADGSLRVAPLGGLYPWKLGEGPVDILAPKGTIPGVLSFGTIHTASAASTVEQVSNSALTWDMAVVITGQPAESLTKAGVRPGTRVVVAESRRKLTRLGDFVAGYFLDDRADLVSWVLALEALKDSKLDCTFVASAAEEVGGEGALFYLTEHRPDICIALELGPNAPDAEVELSDQPTVWASDSYSSMASADLDMVADVGRTLKQELQFQVLSRGGSDASCAASHGLCARPFTLGLPMENSHGYEIMHVGAMDQLAKLTESLVQRLAT